MWIRVVIVVLAVLAFALGLAVVQSPESVRWRAAVVLRKAGGSLPELGWAELVRMLRTPGGYGLWQLRDGRSGFAAVQNPFQTPDDHPIADRLERVLGLSHPGVA